MVETLKLEPMQTQTTETLQVAGAAGALAALSTLNGYALIGAFAGAAIFALSSNEPALLKRLTYMALSITVGYFLGPDIKELLPVKSDMAGAFTVSAVVVTATIVTIDQIKNFNLAELIAKIRRGG